MKNVENFIVIFCVSLLSLAASAQTPGFKPLTFAAVDKGDVNELKVLVSAGANVNAVYDGISLLNYACSALQNKVKNQLVKVLLDSPKINVKTITILDPGNDPSWATTPLLALLSSPSYDSKLDNVIRLIKMGVDINYHSEFNNKFDALIVASYGHGDEGSKAVIMAILNNASPKLNVNYMGKYDATGYLDCVNLQFAEAVEAILKRGAKVEGVSSSESWGGMIPETIEHDNFDVLDIIMKYGANKYGPGTSGMPLNSAMLKAKDVKWAEYFITKYKVDVNHLGKAGTAADEPAINVAAFWNNVEGINFLLKHGANINLSTSQGINAIQMAAQNNSLDAAKYLIEQKAKLTGYNSVFFNAVSYAAVGYHLEMLDLLVKSGADVNEVSKESPWVGPLARLAMMFSPLDKKPRLKTITKLLELGANPNVLHAQDMTAVMCAAKLGTSEGWKAAVENCEVLIKSGANVNLANTAGETALMLASEAGNLKLVNLLIKSGADVNAVNKVGDPAWSYASRARVNNSDIVKALENAGAKPVVVTAKSVSKSVPLSLVGTWKGYQDDNKILMATFVVNKNNTYSYSAVGKVGGKAVSFSHKGAIVASDDTYTLKPEGQASATYSYKIVNGKLSVNNGKPLVKVK